MVKRKTRTTKPQKKLIAASGVKKRVPKRRQRAIGVAALVKSEENPILSPQSGNGWEAWQTFNPGVILLEDPENLRNGASKVHFLYRAIGKDGISRLLTFSH